MSKIINNKAITVIIPSYNRNNELKECLKSLRENSFYLNEIIVLHPFCDKEISNICNEFNASLIKDGSRSNGKRVKGLWGIINKGIDISKNRYVCWLNDDCIVLKNWDKYSLNYFNTKVGLVVLKTKGIGANKKFRTIRAYLDIICANYAVLDKKIGLRFDERYSWYYGDADIAVQCRILYHKKVVPTKEDCVIHKHVIDNSRLENEADDMIDENKEYFLKKWSKFIKFFGFYIKKNRFTNFIERVDSKIKRVVNVSS